MYTKTILAATFAALAAAAPTARQSGDKIILITAHSGNQFVHLRGVVENGLKFWVEGPKETATFCPNEPGVVFCPPGNYTQFLPSPLNQGVSMDAIVPGGQELYVASDASLSTNAAHSHDIGAGGDDTGFTYIPPTVETDGALKFNGQDFTACPADGDFQIFALGYPGFVAAPDCIYVSLVAFTTTLPSVWQYE